MKGAVKNYQVIAKNSQKTKKVFFNLLYFLLFADSENYDVIKQKKITQKKKERIVKFIPTNLVFVDSEKLHNTKHRKSQLIITQN